MLKRAVALCCRIGCSGPALAQPAPSENALAWMRLQVSGQIQRAPYLWSFEQVELLVKPLFLALSPDGKQITREYREQVAKSMAAEVRAGRLQQFLAADVAGTGRIDREMLRTMLSRSMGNRPAVVTSRPDPTVEKYFQEADADGDGFVTYEEAVKAADRQLTSRNANATGSMIPADLDLDGDGIISLQEFRSVIREVYDEIDTDRDGRISQAEAGRYQTETIQRLQREAQERSVRLTVLTDVKGKSANCAIPTWDADTVLTAVFAQGERAMADVSIGGGADVIGAVNVHVEPGDKMLSILLQSPKPTLWQFTGDLRRIALVFVSQQEIPSRPPIFGPNGLVGPASASVESRPASGVTGVSPDRVTFAARSGCLPTSAQGSNVSFQDQLVAAIGRKPDTVVGPAVMTTVRLPSGTSLDDSVFPNAVQVPTDGPGGPLWAMLPSSKRVLIHVDASAVTAALPVKAGPLPGLAGLAAMVDDGRAKIAAWHTVTRFMGPNGQIGPTIIGGGANTRVVGASGTASITKAPSEILLLAPVTLPPGLTSSDLDRLIVARDLPAPSGDRSAICIVREEDARPVTGTRCR